MAKLGWTQFHVNVTRVFLSTLNSVFITTGQPGQTIYSMWKWWSCNLLVLVMKYNISDSRDIMTTIWAHLHLCAWCFALPRRFPLHQTCSALHVSVMVKCVCDLWDLGESSAEACYSSGVSRFMLVYHHWQLLMFMVICMKFTLTVLMRGMRWVFGAVEEFCESYDVIHGAVCSMMIYLTQMSFVIQLI